MKMDLINSLNNSKVVAKIQKCFGVNVNEHLLINNKKIEDLIVDTKTPSHQIPKNGEKINQPEDFNGLKTADDCLIRKDDERCKHVLINNYFWYYLFLFSSELGDEVFYTSFIPFWLWNVDADVGRKTIFVWAVIMTSGQALKDVICWPRPKCPPVIRLQDKWSEEYGMPSTHAAVSITIPLSILYFSKDKYIFSVSYGLACVFLWSFLICLSRLYLGMHSPLDIIAGISLALIMMVPLVPLANFLDYYLITNEFLIAVFIAVSILTIVYYPTSDRWTSTRSDSSMVVSVVSGVYLGAYLNFKTGKLSPRSILEPFIIQWPTFQTIILLITRIMFGFICLAPIKPIFKYSIYKVICAIFNINQSELMKSKNSLDNTYKNLAELTYKMLFTFTFGVFTVYYVPIIFQFIGLLRSEYYSEFI